MKKAFFLLALIVVLIIFFTANYNASNPKSDIIMSEDGLLGLVIPKGALPENVSASDISVRKLKNEDSAFNPEIQDSIIAYTLLPDGLVLKNPATVSLSQELLDDSLPILFHISGENNAVEIVNDTTIGVDLEENTITVSAPISHFSQIGIGTGEASFFKGTVTASDSVVDKKIQSKAVYELKNTLLSPTPRTFQELIKDSIRISGSIERRSDIVNPASVLNKPPLSAFGGANTYSIPGDDFTCIKPGHETLIYKTNITWKVQTTLYHPQEGKIERQEGPISANFEIYTKLFECKKEKSKIISTKMGFDNIDPEGVSDVYVSIETLPGEKVTATTKGPGLIDDAEKSIVADKDGRAYFVWKINKYGDYSSTVTVDGFTEDISASIR